MFRKVLSTAVWTYDVRPVDNVDIDTTANRQRSYNPSDNKYLVSEFVQNLQMIEVCLTLMGEL